MRPLQDILALPIVLSQYAILLLAMRILGGTALVQIAVGVTLLALIPLLAKGIAYELETFFLTKLKPIWQTGIGT
jgi:hypothetical protein